MRQIHNLLLRKRKPPKDAMEPNPSIDEPKKNASQGITRLCCLLHASSINNLSFDTFWQREFCQSLSQASVAVCWYHTVNFACAKFILRAVDRLFVLKRSISFSLW